METGGRFFVYSCCCFLSSCGRVELVFKGVCFWRQKRERGQTGARPRPVCLCLLWLHTNTHANTSLSLFCILFSLRLIVETPISPSFSFSSSLLRDPPQTKGEAGLFLPGMSSPGDPPSWLYSALIKDQQRLSSPPPFSLSVFNITLSHTHTPKDIPFWCVRDGIETHRVVQCVTETLSKIGDGGRKCTCVFVHSCAKHW